MRVAQARLDKLAEIQQLLPAKAKANFWACKGKGNGRRGRARADVRFGRAGILRTRTRRCRLHADAVAVQRIGHRHLDADGQADDGLPHVEADGASQASHGDAHAHAVDRLPHVRAQLGLADRVARWHVD